MEHNLVSFGVSSFYNFSQVPPIGAVYEDRKRQQREISATYERFSGKNGDTSSTSIFDKFNGNGQEEHENAFNAANQKPKNTFNLYKALNKGNTHLIKSKTNSSSHTFNDFENNLNDDDMRERKRKEGIIRAKERKAFMKLQKAQDHPSNFFAYQEMPLTTEEKELGMMNPLDGSQTLIKKPSNSRKGRNAPVHFGQSFEAHPKNSNDHKNSNLRENPFAANFSASESTSGLFASQTCDSPKKMDAVAAKILADIPDELKLEVETGERTIQINSAGNAYIRVEQPSMHNANLTLEDIRTMQSNARDSANLRMGKREREALKSAGVWVKGFEKQLNSRRNSLQVVQELNEQMMMEENMKLASESIIPVNAQQNAQEDALQRNSIIPQETNNNSSEENNDSLFANNPLLESLEGFSSLPNKRTETILFPDEEVNTTPMKPVASILEIVKGNSSGKKNSNLLATKISLDKAISEDDKMTSERVARMIDSNSNGSEFQSPEDGNGSRKFPDIEFSEHFSTDIFKSSEKSKEDFLSSHGENMAMLLTEAPENSNLKDSNALVPSDLFRDRIRAGQTSSQKSFTANELNGLNHTNSCTSSKSIQELFGNLPMSPTLSNSNTENTTSNNVLLQTRSSGINQVPLMQTHSSRHDLDELLQFDECGEFPNSRNFSTSEDIHYTEFSDNIPDLAANTISTNLLQMEEEQKKISENHANALKALEEARSKTDVLVMKEKKYRYCKNTKTFSGASTLVDSFVHFTSRANAMSILRQGKIFVSETKINSLLKPVNRTCVSELAAVNNVVSDENGNIVPIEAKDENIAATPTETAEGEKKFDNNNSEKSDISENAKAESLLALRTIDCVSYDEAVKKSTTLSKQNLLRGVTSRHINQGQK